MSGSGSRMSAGANAMWSSTSRRTSIPGAISRSTSPSFVASKTARSVTISALWPRATPLRTEYVMLWASRTNLLTFLAANVHPAVCIVDVAARRL